MYYSLNRNMRLLPIFLIIVWVIFIIAPDIIAYLLGWLFIFIGLNMLFIWMAFSKKSKYSWDDNYVKFWKYKIYR